VTTATGPARRSGSRRDWQREQTRLDLALAAFRLAQENGLANVRVPQIAAAAGVSPRTFNNYFHSKEAAIAWPATRRADRLADALAGRPADEPLAEALTETVASMYGPDDIDGLPAGWLRDFRALVAVEPALHGEFLKTADVFEAALTEAIARRIGADPSELEPRVLAAIVIAAERAAIRYWARLPLPAPPLVDVIRSAVGLALSGPATRHPAPGGPGQRPQPSPVSGS
jgi:AcrR family transcriptional regulator